jgi:hypothetical protein
MNVMLAVMIVALVIFVGAILFSVFISAGTYKYCNEVSDCAGAQPVIQCDGMWTCTEHSCRFVCPNG